MKRRPKSGVQSYLTDADAIPNPNVPGVRRMRRTAKFYRAIIWGIFVYALLASAAIVAVLLPKNTANVMTDANAQIDAPGKAAAIQAEQDWLAGKPAPLPGGVVLSWDGASKLFQPATLVNGHLTSLPYSSYQHKFTLADSRGTTYLSTVTVVVDPVNGSIVQGQPSLLPLAPDSTSTAQSIATWPGYKPSTVPSSINDAVAVWANAMISGSPDALRLAVGDPSKKHSYMPMVGISAVRPSIQDGSYVLPADASNKTTTSDTMFARVTLTFTWDGQAAAKDGATSNSAAYDVLVKRADTASPIVTAWGAPGSGPDLSDYENALTGRTLELGDSAATPTAAPEGKG